MFLQHNTSQIVGKAAEKLITSYQLILHKDSSWSSRTRKYHLNKGITSQIKREWKTREDIPFWALHKNAFLLRGAKRLITTTKGAMMKGQGCPLQIPFSTSFCTLQSWSTGIMPGAGRTLLQGKRLFDVLLLLKQQTSEQQLRSWSPRDDTNPTLLSDKSND